MRPKFIRICIALSAGFLLTTATLLVVIFSSIVPNSSKYNSSMVQTKFTVIDLPEEAYRCCSILCERGSCTEYEGVSCGSLLERREEGTCEDGYSCCVMDARNMCEDFVDNRECEVVCNKCYNPKIVLRYRNGDSMETVYIEHKGCKLISCVHDFFDGYYVNQTLDGFYNRYDTYDFQLGDKLKPYKLDGAEIAGLVVTSIMYAMIAFYGYAFYLILKEDWELEQNMNREPLIPSYHVPSTAYEASSPLEISKI
jgi:hypothetical protein